MLRRLSKRAIRSAFTLIEMMVAMAILSLILLMMFQITSNTGKIWQHTRARIGTFQEGRDAFSTVTSSISQAILNTYWDYADQDGKTRSASASTGGAGNFVPKKYLRQSDLQFITGPSSSLLTGIPGVDGSNTATCSIFYQAPLGITEKDTVLSSLLNATGYFLQYSDDTDERPNFLKSSSLFPPRYRWRLKELRQPAEKFSLYDDSRTGFKSKKWFQDALKDPSTRHTVAENVIAFLVLAKRSPNDQPASGSPATLAPDYNYDSRLYENSTTPYSKISRNQLPPMVKVTMVVVDEKNAQRIADRHGNSQTPPPELRVTGFTSEGQYDADLKALEDQLTNDRITYRIFSADINILQAKWSESLL